MYGIYATNNDILMKFKSYLNSNGRFKVFLEELHLEQKFSISPLNLITYKTYQRLFAQITGTVRNAILLKCLIIKLENNANPSSSIGKILNKKNIYLVI